MIISCPHLSIAQFIQQGSKLIGTGSNAGQQSFGNSIAISADGNTAIVGAPGDAAGKGAGFIYTLVGNDWVQTAKLVGTAGIGQTAQGVSVAISADGNTAVIGGSGDNANTGAAWVFVRNGNNWQQQGTKLVGSGVSSAAYFGFSVAVSGDGNTIVIGADRDNNNAGAAWIFVRNGNVWTQEGNKLTGTGAVGAAFQGHKVTISADGNTVAIGGYNDNQSKGASWIFTRNSNAWTQQGNKLVGTGASATSLQGSSVSLSADGNTLVVGGQGDNNSRGAAWVFNRSSNSWSQTGAKLVGTNAIGQSYQGIAVSISADAGTIAIGGFNDQVDVINNSATGAVWIYVLSAGSWSQQGTKLTVNDALNSASFGVSVALSENGNRLAGGGFADDAFTGAAWIFNRNGNAWTQMGAKLTSPQIFGASWQGWAVAMSADGNTVVSGGPLDNNNKGACWIFTRTGNNWQQPVSKLSGTGNIGNSLQGHSVAISADGNTLVIGAPGDNSNAGAVWIFVRSGNNWLQQGTKLVGSGASGNARQGNSVAISADGNTIAVGGDDDNASTGAVWIFTRTAAVWSQQGNKLVGTGSIGSSRQGTAVALSADGNTLLSGGNTDDNGNGAVWVFGRTGSTWSQVGNKLIANDATGAANFGHSLDIAADGNTFISSGSQDNNANGAAWIFNRSGNNWIQQGNKLVGTGANGQALQGVSVAMDGNGNRVAIAGSLDNNVAGATWVFERNGNVWTQYGNKITATDAVGQAEFGNSIAISADGNSLVAGGYFDQSGIGANFIFTNQGQVLNPVIQSFNPDSGTTGQVISINGLHFTGATAVHFGGTAATSFNVVNDQLITAVVGAGSSGDISVTTASGTAQSAGFNFILLPTASISGNNTVCVNAVSPLVTFTGAGSIAPYTFEYSINGGPVQSITTVTGNSISLPVATNIPGSFQYSLLTVTDGNGITANVSGSVAVTVSSVFVLTGNINGFTNVCRFIGTGETVTYSIPAVAGATSYNWTIPPTLNLVSGQGTQSITVTIGNNFIANANKLIRLRVVSDCGTSADKLLYLHAQAPSTPGFISGPGNACSFIGTAALASFSIAPVAGAAEYLWTTQAGTTIVTHPNGTGINDTIVNIAFGSGFTTSYITVQSRNACGTSAPRNFLVTRNPLAAPNIISGPTNVCAYTLPDGAPGIFSVSPVAGAQFYNWTVPAGSIVSHPNPSGPADTIINVQFPTGFSSGNLSVSVSGGCGTTAAATLPLQALTPSTPGGITATMVTPCTNRTIVYSIPSMPLNTIVLNWTVPFFGVIITGQGLNSITVAYPSNAVSGTVSVTGYSQCGESVTRTISINLPDCPGFFSRQQEDNNVKDNPDSLTPELLVYPNPSTDYFNVRFSSVMNQPVMIQLTDVQGRIRKQIRLNASTNFSFGNDLEAGIYFLKTVRGATVSRLKLIKNQ